MAGSEDETPLEERYLWLEGTLAPEALEAVQPGLPKRIPPDSVILFVGFAYADLPLGKSFDVVFPKGRPDAGVKCRSRVHAATQQWATPLDGIPHGWKTVCIVQFPDGVPRLVRELPAVVTWHQNSDWVCICGEDTWERLKAVSGGRA